MVKRMAAALAALLLAAAFLFPAAGAAAAGDLRVEQVQVEMPQVRAYLADGGGDIPAEVTATLGGKPLTSTEVRRYDAALDPTSYFFLVDCSTSTTWGQMEAIKAALTDFANNMEQGTSLTLITFGVDVQVPLQRETDPGAIIGTVAALAPDQPGTVFFDALARAIELASGQDFALERKLAFVFSDSVDYNLGGYTKDEIDKMLLATGLPFYALGFETGAKQELDNFGAVARQSGGTIAVVSEYTMQDALNEMLAGTRNVLVASFDAGTNVIDAPTQEFTATLDDGRSASMQVPVRHWQADTEAPTVLGVEQRTEESIWLQFSELVQGAGLAESFVVKNGNGDLMGIRAAAYDEAERAVTLTFTAPPPTGEYILECPGITDLSSEQNSVAGSMTFSFEGAPAVEEPVDDDMPIGFWVFVIILAIAVIVIVVVLATRKRRVVTTTVYDSAFLPGGEGGFVEVDQPVPAGGEVQVHFKQSAAPLPKIKLDVTGPSGQSRVVEVPINKTLFVGRSDICDVYFDDPAMSRQHFAIGEENGGYVITNLSETGGTTLNGVKLQNPRPLHDGDTIGAGKQSIVFFGALGAGGVQ